jgi:hypothetical protein
MSGPRKVCLAFVVGLLLALPALAGAAAPGARPFASGQGMTAPAQAIPASVPARAHASAAQDATDYAAREASAKGLERYEGGGSGVYIGGSTVVIVLLIVLLIVIL